MSAFTLFALCTIACAVSEPYIGDSDQTLPAVNVKFDFPVSAAVGSKHAQGEHRNASSLDPTGQRERIGRVGHPLVLLMQASPRSRSAHAGLWRPPATTKRLLPSSC